MLNINELPKVKVLGGHWKPGPGKEAANGSCSCGNDPLTHSSERQAYGNHTKVLAPLRLVELTCHPTGQAAGTDVSYFCASISRVLKLFIYSGTSLCPQ